MKVSTTVRLVKDWGTAKKGSDITVDMERGAELVKLGFARYYYDTTGGVRIFPVPEGDEAA